MHHLWLIISLDQFKDWQKIGKHESKFSEFKQMNNKLPTCKQLERDLAHSIKAFYVKEINHPPQKVTCKIFSRYIAIVAEEALTPLEQNLWKSGEQDFIVEVRSEINKIFKPKMRKLIEEMLNIEVEDILNNVTFRKNQVGTLVVLSHIPLTRKPKSLSKPRKKKVIQKEQYAE